MDDRTVLPVGCRETGKQETLVCENNSQSCWSAKPPTGFHCLKSVADIRCAKVTCSVVLHKTTRCVSSVPWLAIFWEYHAISTDGTDTLLDDISSQLINKYYLQNKI